MTTIATDDLYPDPDKLCLRCFQNALPGSDLCQYHTDKAAELAKRKLRFRGRMEHLRRRMRGDR